jgi:hypothetical protein
VLTFGFRERDGNANCWCGLGDSKTAANIHVHLQKRCADVCFSRNGMVTLMAGHSEAREIERLLTSQWTFIHMQNVAPARLAMSGAA